MGALPAVRGDPRLRRGLGAARNGNLAQARDDQARLAALRDALLAAKVGYWADQVDIQRLLVAGWIARAEGRNDDAVQLIRAAADREDATEKHPVTPGSIVPAREVLGELLLDLGRPAEALREFEASQQKEPNRLRGYYGVARAAELSGDAAKAKSAVQPTPDPHRPGGQPSGRRSRGPRRSSRSPERDEPTGDSSPKARR